MFKRGAATITSGETMIEGTAVSPEIQRQHRKGELLFFWGVLLASTIFLGPIGFPLMLGASC